MSKTLRTSTENKHEPLLARLMNGVQSRRQRRRKKQVTLLLANAVAGSPSTNWCSQTCVELVHAAKRSALWLTFALLSSRLAKSSPHRTGESVLV